MTNLSRKVLARQAREIELIDIARDIIESDGLSSLTMDKLTARCDYSKGTVYNHFSCKEDLLVAVSNEGLKDLGVLFDKLEHFTGNTRERMLGLQLAYLYFSLLYPSQFLCVLSVKNPAILSRTSAERKLQQIELEIALEDRAGLIIKEAIDLGELQLNDGVEVKQISFANWSQSFGALVLFNASESLIGLQGLDIGKEFFSNAFILNDGFKWKPLSTDTDYFQSIEKLNLEVFQLEAAQAKEKKQQKRDQSNPVTTTENEEPVVA